MKTKQAFSNTRALIPSVVASVLCGTLVLLAGCESEPESYTVPAPPPPAPAAAVSTTTTSTTTTPAVTSVQLPNGQVVANQPANTVVVTQPPPATQVETVTASPSPDYRWVPGHWSWRDSRYEWIAGHWEIPPRPDAVWVAPHWDSEHGAYQFYEGYWNY